MESDDGDDTHTPFTTLSWQAVLIVRRLKIQAPERGAKAEAIAPKSGREDVPEGTQSGFRRAEASAPDVRQREAVKFK
jgi:hypothetical protein